MLCCWLQVLDVAHWASLPPGKQAELYGRRALVSKAANHPVASFADWLHAAQVLLLLYRAVCEQHLPTVEDQHQGLNEMDSIAADWNSQPGFLYQFELL